MKCDRNNLQSLRAALDAEKERADTNAETAYRNRLELGEAEKTIQALRAECHAANARADAAEQAARSWAQRHDERAGEAETAESEAASLRAVAESHVTDNIRLGEEIEPLRAEVERLRALPDPEGLRWMAAEADIALLKASLANARSFLADQIKLANGALDTQCEAETRWFAARAEVEHFRKENLKHMQALECSESSLAEARALLERITVRGGCGLGVHGWIDAWLSANPEPPRAYHSRHGSDVFVPDSPESPSTAAERAVLRRWAFDATLGEMFGIASGAYVLLSDVEAELARRERATESEAASLRLQIVGLENQAEGAELAEQRALTEAAALRAEVERLRTERKYVSQGGHWCTRAEAAESSLTEARAEVERLRLLLGAFDAHGQHDSLAEARELLADIWVWTPVHIGNRIDAFLNATPAEVK